MNALELYESLRPEIEPLPPAERERMRAQLFGSSVDLGLVATIGLQEGVPVTGRRRGGGVRWWLLLGAAVVLAMALGAVGMTDRARHLTPGDMPVIEPPPSGQVWKSDDLRRVPNGQSVGRGWSEPPWDPVPVAPGTIGWFEAGDGLPAELRDQRGEGGEPPTTSAIAGLFVCRAWRIDGGEPTCTQLGGGGGIAQVTYGPQLGVGVQLGGADARAELWNVAGEALWSTTAMNARPEPAIVPVGDTTGYRYRVGDLSYLAWEHAPGVVVWLRAHGLDDETVARIAAGVRPVELPRSLPLLMQLDDPTVTGGQAPVASTGTGAPSGATTPGVGLQLGYLDGQPCVGIDVSTRCAATRRPALFGFVAWQAEHADRIVAIAPSGLASTLHVNVDGQGWQAIPVAHTDFGFDVASWASDGSTHLRQAQLTNYLGHALANSETLDPPADRDSACAMFDGPMAPLCPHSPSQRTGGR